MALSADRLRRLSDQTASDSGLVIDDCEEAYDLSRLYVPRDIEPDIIRRVRASPGCTVLVGEAGSGKTSLLWHIHQRLQDTNPVIFLRAEFVVDPEDHNPDELCRALDQLRSVKGSPILLIDTADAVVGTPRRRQALLEVINGASDLGCATIVSSRPQEAGRYFPGYDKKPVPDRYSEREFAQIVETHAKHFYGRQSDLEPISTRVADILAIVSQGQPVADLAMRPLLLRMLFSLYAPDKIPADINTPRLYDTYWDRRVCTDWRAGRPEPEPDAADHAHTALAIAYRMLLDGTLRLPLLQVGGVLKEVSRPLTDIRHLVSRGVLRRVSSECNADSIEFFHQTFFEHAAARSIIERHGPMGLDLLVDRLRAHPDDHLRLPVLEHVLILSQSSQEPVRTKGQERVEQILKNGPIHLQRAAVTAYAQMPSISQRLRDSFSACLKDRNLVVSFVHATPSVPLTRCGEVWDCFRQIWAPSATLEGRQPWAARRAVLEQLPCLARREQKSASDVTAFLHDYGVIESIMVDSVQDVVGILMALVEREPLKSLALLKKLLHRLNSEFAGHKNVNSPVVLAIARHPNATSELLQTVIDGLSSCNDDRANRVRGVVQARLWHQNNLQVQDILRTITSPGGVRELSALTAWLSEQPTKEIWDQVWNHFVLHGETLAGREWVRHLWDRLGLQPADKGDIPSVRASKYLTAVVASAIRDASPTERHAGLHVCRYSFSFELRIAILQTVLEGNSAPLSTSDLCEPDALGLLLGPAIAVRVPEALKIFQYRPPLPSETQSRLIEDVDSLIIRAPEFANDVVLFLIYSGEFPKIEPVIANDGLRLQALPSDAASSLSTAIMRMLTSSPSNKRQKGARLAFHGLARGLGITLEFEIVVQIIASEADELALGWLAMALCELAEANTQVDTALTWAFRAATGHEYVRDKAFEALLDLVITRRRLDLLDSVLETAERPTLNLRRILAIFFAVPRVAVLDPRGAARLAYRMLTLPSLQAASTRVLSSIGILARKPFIQWSQVADVVDLLALVAAIPSLDGRVGQLILNVLYHPPHKAALHDAIKSLACDPDVPIEVQHHIPVLFRKQSGADDSNCWEELLALSGEESYNVIMTWDTFIAFASADQAFAVQLKQEIDAYGRKAFCSAVDLPGTPSWDNAIKDAQHGAHTTVVLLTLAAIASPHVNTEIQRAITWKKHVVPVPLDAAMQDWTAWPSGLSVTQAARGTPVEVAATVAAGAPAPGVPDRSTLHACLIRRTESELDAFSIELGINRAHLPGGHRTPSELAAKILDLAANDVKVAAAMRNKHWL